MDGIWLLVPLCVVLKEFSMTTSFIIHLGRETIFTALMVAGPIIIVGFAVGLLLSLFQAVMQLQEMTIAFVPKLLAMGASLLIFGNWMLTKLMIYAHGILGGFTSMLQ